MSYNILLNNTHCINSNGTCNTYKYNFIQGGFDIPEGSSICVTNITIPYSWYNISSICGNNYFSYSIPSSLGSVSVTVTIPDGFYTISDLNNLLSKSLFSSNFYFYNSSNGVSDPSQIIYPIQFATNAANYTNSIIFQYIPTSSGNVVTQFGTNWLYANPNIFPVHASLPTITIPQVLGQNITSSTYGLGNILGFTNGTYPASYTLYYNLATTNTTDSPTISNSSPVVINGKYIEIIYI